MPPVTIKVRTSDQSDRRVYKAQSILNRIIQTTYLHTEVEIAVKWQKFMGNDLQINCVENLTLILQNVKKKNDDNNTNNNRDAWGYIWIFSWTAICKSSAILYFSAQYVHTYFVCLVEFIFSLSFIQNENTERVVQAYSFYHQDILYFILYYIYYILYFIFYTRITISRVCHYFLHYLCQ